MTTTGLFTHPLFVRIHPVDGLVSCADSKDADTFEQAFRDLLNTKTTTDADADTTDDNRPRHRHNIWESAPLAHKGTSDDSARKVTTNRHDNERRTLDSQENAERESRHRNPGSHRQVGDLQSTGTNHHDDNNKKQQSFQALPHAPATISLGEAAANNPWTAVMGNELKKLVRVLHQSSVNQRKRVSLTLSLNDSGEVRLDVRFKGKQLFIKAVVNGRRAAAALAGSIEELKARLRECNLELAEFDITVDKHHNDGYRQNEIRIGFSP